jgi:uncharacterized lipoprotein YddW (UPF0748 family)
MSIKLTCAGALLAALVGCALLPFAAPALAGTQPVDVRPSAGAGRTERVEVRGLWVLRSSLTSPQSVAALVRTASASGFNALFVQVRGRGEAYYQSAIDPRATDLAAQPAQFDPLRDLIAAAHAANIRVHAWVNVNLVSSAAQLPEPRTHVVYRHPDWLMVPRAVVQELRSVDGHSPAYFGKLSRWTRAQSEIEGLYLSPIVPEAANYTVSVVAELASRYPLDGVHLDYVRYPGADFDYSRYSVAEFRTEIAPTLPSPLRATLDTRARIDPFAYPDALPAEWAQFRRARLTSLAMRLRSAVKRARPDAMVSAAVVPDAEEALTNRLQDWRTWVESGILDAICPMAYTTDATVFAQQISGAHAIAGVHGVWAGIGAWRLSPEQTIQHIGLARKAGAAGLVLFSYDSLTGPSQARGDYLDEVARAVFASTTAAVTSGKQ